MSQFERLFIEEKHYEFLDMIQDLLIVNTVGKVSQMICDVFVKNYNVENADYISEVIRLIYEKQPIISRENNEVENPFFNLSLFTGSWSIYKVYFECHIQKHLMNLDDNSRMEYIIDMYTYSENIINMLFDNYTTCVNGVNYNGKMQSINNNTDYVMLPIHGYEAMNDIIENYNKIIGRRNILKDIESKMDEN